MLAYFVNTFTDEATILSSRLSQGGITRSKQQDTPDRKSGAVMNELWTSLLINLCQFEPLCSGSHSDTYFAWFGWIVLLYIPGIAILLTTIIRKMNTDA